MHAPQVLWAALVWLAFSLGNFMQTKLNRRFFTVAAAVALCAGAVQAQVPLGAAAGARLHTLSHSKGSTQVVAAPQRVVVYDLATLDTMQALGIAVAAGPKAQLPQYLESMAASYTVAGSLFEPDYAVLSQLQPDLVIVGGRSAARYETLSKVLPTADFSVRRDHMLHDMQRNILQLAQLYGKEQQGQALVNQIEREVAELRQLASQAAPGVLLLTLNERIAPQAPGGRFGFLFDVLGAKSLLTQQDVPARGAPAYTFEDVAKLQPQWIYVIDRNAATGSAAGGAQSVPAQKVLDNAQIASTPAAQKGQVVFLDPKGWYLMGSTGPTALLRNIAQLKRAYANAQR